MVGWLKLKCAIQTESVKIQNVKIDMYPDATTGCIKHYLLAEITKSGHQFVMRNFDDLRIVLVKEADLYESEQCDGTLMICSWSASSECDYDRITQTAQFRESRKASGGDWEVSLLICTKSHAEVQEEAKKEQEEQERSIRRIRTPSPEAENTPPPGVFLTVDGMVANLYKRWNPDHSALAEWEIHIRQNHAQCYHAAIREYERIDAMMKKLTKIQKFQYHQGSSHVQPSNSESKTRHRHKLCNRSTQELTGLCMQRR